MALATGCPDFTVEMPRPERALTVRAGDFGLDCASERNAQAIRRALLEAKRIGASCVELAPGTYRCYDEPGIVIENFRDFTFDGKGAVLVFRRAAEYRGQPQSELILDKGSVLVRGCERTQIGGFTMDWDWERDPLAGFVRVVDRHVDDLNREESYLDVDFVDYVRHPKYPEPVPVQKLNLDGRSGAKPVARWFVDPPTETTRGPLSYFETLMADGVSASASPAQAFDGTTYALGAGDLMCTCAAGAEIVIAIPEAATLTRGLKLKAYRIHQMSAGEHPNGRAPTAWTLYGKRTDDGNWAEIDRVTMTTESAN